MMQDFRQLRVWQAAHQFALLVYDSTATFPKEETYGLRAQLGRSATSIPANMAEGCGRETNTDMARFFQISMGSAAETEYHILLSRDLGYISVEDYKTLNAQLQTVRRMLNKFLAKLRNPDVIRGEVGTVAEDPEGYHVMLDNSDRGDVPIGAVEINNQRPITNNRD